MTDHADTIRRAIDAAGAEGHIVADAWDALDALLAERQQLQEAHAALLAYREEAERQIEQLEAERRQAQEKRDEAMGAWQQAQKEMDQAGERLQQAIDALREPLEPCGDFPSKLEWLAYWLDSVDVLIEALPDAEPLGRDVQHDLRRWAEQWRALVKLGEKP